MPTATVTSKGQITVPKPIREHLNLVSGSRLEFLIDPSGEVRVVPVTQDVRSLKGMLPKPDKAVSVAAMNKVIRQSAGR